MRSVCAKYTTYGVERFAMVRVSKSNLPDQSTSESSIKIKINLNF